MKMGEIGRVRTRGGGEPLAYPGLPAREPELVGRERG
jgi:hypothetical protein